jgi:hypothetical protein
MKTVCRDGLSLYLFADDDYPVVITDGAIYVGDPLDFIVADCNSSNSVMLTTDFAPEDWVGGKYFFDGDVWEENPMWVPSE